MIRTADCPVEIDFPHAAQIFQIEREIYLISSGRSTYVRKDKARFYRMAKRSAIECAAIVDICRILKLSTPQRLARCRTLLLDIVCMLIKLIKALDRT